MQYSYLYAPPLTAADLAPLTKEEVAELERRLARGLWRACDVYQTDSIIDRDDTYPIVPDLAKTHDSVFKEVLSRQLGCQERSCRCRHTSCPYCPTCNPAAKGDDSGDDAEMDALEALIDATKCVQVIRPDGSSFFSDDGFFVTDTAYPYWEGFEVRQVYGDPDLNDWAEVP